jgi:hypothetical protein
MYSCTKDEAIALMSPQEIKEFAKAYGTPVYDQTSGKLLGMISCQKGRHHSP